MVAGARRERAAIVRSETPSARPREISSRSVSESTRGERRLSTGTYPPVVATMRWMALRSLPSARPISLSDWPAFQRDHISRVCSAVNAGLPHCAMGPPPDQHCTHQGVASIG